MVPSLDILKTSLTSHRPVISSLISGESNPSIASFNSLMASYIIEYVLISISSFSATSLAFPIGLTLKPITNASDAEASSTSLSVIAPTPL